MWKLEHFTTNSKYKTYEIYCNRGHNYYLYSDLEKDTDADRCPECFYADNEFNSVPPHIRTQIKLLIDV